MITPDEAPRKKYTCWRGRDETQPYYPRQTASHPTLTNLLSCFVSPSPPYLPAPHSYSPSALLSSPFPPLSPLSHNLTLLFSLPSPRYPSLICLFSSLSSFRPVSILLRHILLLTPFLTPFPFSSTPSLTLIFSLTPLSPFSVSPNHIVSLSCSTILPSCLLLHLSLTSSPLLPCLRFLPLIHNLPLLLYTLLPSPLLLLSVSSSSFSLSSLPFSHIHPFLLSLSPCPPPLCSKLTHSLASLS